MEEVLEQAIENIRVPLSMLSSYTSLFDLLSQVTANSKQIQRLTQEGASQQEIDIASEVEKGLVAQLTVTSQLLINDTSRFAEEANAEATEAQRLASSLTVILVIVLATTITTSSLLVARSISKPLDELTKGAKIVGKRDLEHKVGVKSKDELGQLAAAFNEMTGSLRTITASRDELDREVAERKRAEGLIKEQNERLKELDRMKSEFLSTAAHELRIPLTSILGFSEILLEKETNQEKRNRFLKIINEESMGLSSLINDLLDVTRIESGKGFKMVKAPTDMGEIIRENVDIFQAQTDKHTFRVNIPSDLVKVEADKDKISQVMENLISNALKFSPEGGEIAVSIQQDKDEVKVSVSDNGMGIPKKELPHVFEKFYRGEDASSEAIGGTGLGLAIVKYIVQHHGGTISAESKLKKGSTFSFTLP